MSHFWLRNRPSDLLARIFVMILAGVLLVGCTTTEPVSELPVPEETPPPVELTLEQEAPPEPVGPGRDGEPLPRVSFYDFDKALLSPSELSELEQWASFLREERGTIVIEGHCDERGTNEYNLGLGDSRAAAVRDYLVSLGIPGNRITTVSRGEESPFCSDSHEGCWSRNRRGQFVVTAK